MSDCAFSILLGLVVGGLPFVGLWIDDWRAEKRRLRQMYVDGTNWRLKHGLKDDRPRP